MTSDDPPFSDLGGARDYSRALLVLVCLLAIVVAASALPVLAPDGTRSPIASVVPVPGGTDGGAGASTSGSGSGGLGALSPGQQTAVGGSLGGEGALQSRSAEVHFVVESSAPAYWRTGAYGTYTGTGWDRPGESTPANGTIETRGMDGARVSYEVTLNRTARALPTVWRPRSISGENGRVTTGRAVRTERALPAGTTYSGVSDRPPSDESLLRTAGTDYPGTVERRYTQLPGDTETRLGPTTDEITADASTPYETAAAVESWLESNKEYSLNVSEPPDDDVASQFVTEMDAGYCEYFATSMTAMLRTQDVPARYVVGYSTGQRTGENSYTVRGMNAHAWVEVYFPEVGWVTFDPTPAAERRQGERESLQNRTGASGEGVTATPPSPGTNGTGTPTGSGDGDGTEASSNGGDGTEQGGSDGADDRRRTSGDDTVTLNRSAAPGAVVEVTVTDDGPVSGATVLFNGESVGTTAADGTVTGRVPYTERLNVSVVDGERAPVVAPVVPAGGSDRLFALDQPRANRSATFDLETNATVSVSGDVVTGNTVTVAAVVDDVPIRDAPVALNGERVARTDRNGRADVTLPDEPGNATLSVDRGSVSGGVTVELARLNVTARPTTLLPLPATGVAVDATLDGDPASGVNVTMGGRQVATTGVDGTATASLPLAASATVGVEAHGQRRTVTYDGLYLNLALVGLAVAAVLGGLVAVARRYGITPGRGLGWPRRVGQWIVGAVVALGTAADDALGRLADRVRLTVAHGRALLAGRRSLSDLLDALRAWARDRADGVRSPVETGVRSLVTATGSEAESTDAHATIRESWEGFLEAVSIRRPGTRTPGEIASHAVTVDDLPETAVATLRDAFRAVEYGQRDPGERAADVESAAAAIESAVDARDDANPTGDAVRGADGTDDRPAGSETGVTN